MQKFGETLKLYCKDDSNNIQVAGHTQMTVTEVSVLERDPSLQSATTKSRVNCRFVSKIHNDLHINKAFCRLGYLLSRKVTLHF
jgi:hypothetical protein